MIRNAHDTKSCKICMVLKNFETSLINARIDSRNERISK